MCPTKLAPEVAPAQSAMKLGLDAAGFPDQWSIDYWTLCSVEVHWKQLSFSY